MHPEIGKCNEENDDQQTHLIRCPILPVMVSWNISMMWGSSSWNLGVQNFEGETHLKKHAQQIIIIIIIIITINIINIITINIINIIIIIINKWRFPKMGAPQIGWFILENPN